MGMMMRLDRRGHGVIAEWGTGSIGRRRAEKIFAEHVAAGFNMADISEGRDGEFITAFDPEIEEILAVPKMVAG
jgi:hypothetical protein